MSIIQEGNLHFKISDPRLRIRIAKQIRQARKIERSFGFIHDRTGNDYLRAINGLENLFAYIRDFVGSKVVLDVGAGASIGTYELSYNRIARDLQFIATGLRISPLVSKYFGLDDFYVTSGELLRGIATNSIGGVIALNSIAYSCDLEIVAHSLNRVLVPGGVIKATFRSKSRNRETRELSASYDKLGFNSPEKFISTLNLLGFEAYDFEHGTVSVVIAVKGGNRSPYTAENLARSDAC